MDQQAKVVESVDPAARVRNVRARLPGQVLRQRIDTARACHGELYTLAEVRQKVIRTLPRRLGFARTVVLQPMETYRERIPDEALIKYDDAVRSALFSKFWVATPSYRGGYAVDPWILAYLEDIDMYAVIARVGRDLTKRDDP